jgi:hypothetical protein
MLLNRGDLHALMMTARSPLRKNPARYRAGSGGIVLLSAKSR